MLTKVTVLVGVIGAVEMSLTVAEQVVGLFSLTEPGEHETDVVVVGVVVEVVALIP